jgi:hypothetical protein
VIRVAYVIDHKRSRHDRWVPRPVQTTLVTELDPENAERFELWRAPIVEDLEMWHVPVVDSGYEIRVRVWPYSTDAELEVLDPDRDEPAGQWTYGPHAGN